MATSVTFRPQVSLAPTVVQQSEANNCREKLNKVETDARNNQITDISAMTQRMQIESQLRDTKVAPVKYVEEIKPKVMHTAQPSDYSVSTRPKTVTDVIARMHNGKVPSKVEQSQVLANEMNLMAASNRVLHGLF